VQRALARLLARLPLGGGALAHRRRGLRLGFRAGARVGRGLLLLAPPAFGERRRLLFRLLALARLGERRRFGALALGDEARGLCLRVRARVGDAPQLDLGRLALAGKVEGALLVAGARLRDFLGAWHDVLARSLTTRARWSIDVDPLEF